MAGEQKQPSPTYPFVPQSTSGLRPGPFCAIPQDDGRFGCGRVPSLRVSD